MNLARQWHDDSTEAVSNVEPNTVVPNSKDQNQPSIQWYLPIQNGGKKPQRRSREVCFI